MDEIARYKLRIARAIRNDSIAPDLFDRVMLAARSRAEQGPPFDGGRVEITAPDQLINYVRLQDGAPSLTGADLVGFTLSQCDIDVLRVLAHIDVSFKGCVVYAISIPYAIRCCLRIVDGHIGSLSVVSKYADIILRECSRVLPTLLHVIADGGGVELNRLSGNATIQSTNPRGMMQAFVNHCDLTCVRMTGSIAADVNHSTIAKAIFDRCKGEISISKCVIDDVIFRASSIGPSFSCTTIETVQVDRSIWWADIMSDTTVRFMDANRSAMVIGKINGSNALGHRSIALHGRQIAMFVGPVGSASRIAYAIVDADGVVWVTAGCWTSTLDRFIERINEVYGNSQSKKESIWHAQYTGAAQMFKSLEMKK